MVKFKANFKGKCGCRHTYKGLGGGGCIKRKVTQKGSNFSKLMMEDKTDLIIYR